MTARVKTPDGLIGYPIQTKQGPMRRWWCQTCEANVPNKQRSKIGTYAEMMAWWSDHKQAPRHQAKMGAVSDEVFIAAASSVELAQRNKALARLRAR